MRTLLLTHGALSLGLVALLGVVIGAQAALGWLGSRRQVQALTRQSSTARGRSWRVHTGRAATATVAVDL
jgi:hypothetical protein